MTTTPERAAEAADLGRPSARKAGRDPRWPYVPVVITTDDTGMEHQRQVLNRAHETRAEAVTAAERFIERDRAQLRRKLADPRYRLLRAQYGVDA
jgi:hypothetical protein